MTLQKWTIKKYNQAKEEKVDKKHNIAKQRKKLRTKRLDKAKKEKVGTKT
jgi:hypothetical protein